MIDVEEGANPKGMYINGILNVNLMVRSIEEVRAFYTEALGLPLATEAPGVLSFYYGNTALNVLQARGDDHVLVGRQTGLGLRTQRDNDIGPIAKRMRGKGRTQGDLQLDSWPGGSCAIVTDPCNNIFTIWGCRDEHLDDYPHLFDGPATVAIHTSDLRRSLAFYYGLLQLPMADESPPGTATFFHEGTRLILSENNAWKTTQATRGETGLCFESNDLDSLVQNLEHNRVPLAESIQSSGDTRGASVRDPDGNLLSFLCQM